MFFTKREHVGIPVSVLDFAVLSSAPVHCTMAVNSEIVILFAAGMAKAILIHCYLSSQFAPNLVFEADAG